MTEEQYTQAESFWTRKDETEKKLDADTLYQWIDEFLSSHKVLALATAAEDFVRCTPLEYSWHDGALWIFTEGGLKFRALRKNKHVAAAVFDANASFGGLKSLQLEGTAEPVELFSDAYQKAAAFRKIPLEVLRKLEEPMWLLKIVPTEITCLNSDFKKDGYGSRQEYYSYTNQHVKSNELG
ncbi:MAG: pyridoxamine 5'-phosphate oxidase family protein [Oribacterium sp.]|nr:pyridoxamine 5'-phosphate oxidase family protein [Oribacterium sp.]